MIDSAIVPYYRTIERSQVLCYHPQMAQFVHPPKDDMTLEGVLGALADPTRLRIVHGMLKKGGVFMSCTRAAPCPKIAKSTLSNHFRILREAGLIRTTKQGVEHRNTVRIDDINERFPGLLKLVMKLADLPNA